METKNKQYIIGWILALAIMIWGLFFLEDNMFPRLLIGLSFGYALSRGFIGFASSASRTYGNGSTKLIRTLMFMFAITTVGVTAFVYFGYPVRNINPISLGLILGATFFGFGMIFSSCCATGILAGASTNITKFIITLFFFGLGIIVAWPLAAKSFVTESWFESSTGRNGVYLPEFFGDSDHALFFGVIVTILLAILVSFGFKMYEEKRKENGTYEDVTPEVTQDAVEVEANQDAKYLSMETYERLFVNPWSRKMAAMAISFTFILLVAFSTSGWGASTPYGMWVGKFLTIIPGVTAESLAEYTGQSVSRFDFVILENGTSVQNIGIILGAFVAMLTAGRFKGSFKVDLKSVVFLATGGFIIGAATRIAGGCNVGALYTPIAYMSLSGWVFLAFMLTGGYLGVKLKKFLDTKWQ